MISFDDFQKVEMRVAKVLEAVRVEGSDKLLKLKLDAGDKSETGEALPRQVIAGIGKSYEPDTLVGREIIIAANLEPRMLMGLESQGMILAGSDEGGLKLISIEGMKPGSIIK